MSNRAQSNKDKNDRAVVLAISSWENPVAASTSFEMKTTSWFYFRNTYCHIFMSRARNCHTFMLLAGAITIYLFHAQANYFLQITVFSVKTLCRL